MSDEKNKEVTVLEDKSTPGYETPMIRGPFGFWMFPLLNAILQFIYALRRINYNMYEYRSKKKIYQLVRDDKGRIVEILEFEM